MPALSARIPSMDTNNTLCPSVDSSSLVNNSPPSEGKGASVAGSTLGEVALLRKAVRWMDGRTRRLAMRRLVEILEDPGATHREVTAVCRAMIFADGVDAKREATEVRRRYLARKETAAGNVTNIITQINQYDSLFSSGKDGIDTGGGERVENTFSTLSPPPVSDTSTHTSTNVQ